MKQSSFPPTVKEPQDQLLCSSTAGVTPPSSVLSSLLSQMTWFVFLIEPFFVSLYNEYCNYWPEGLYSNKGNGWVGGCMRFQVEGNNTVWFPQGDDCVCAGFNQSTRLWVLNWGSILYERGLLLKKSVMFMQLYFNYCEEKGYLEYITNRTRIEIKPLTYRFILCFQEQIFKKIFFPQSTALIASRETSPTGNKALHLWAAANHKQGCLREMSQIWTRKPVCSTHVQLELLPVFSFTVKALGIYTLEVIE